MIAVDLHNHTLHSHAKDSAAAMAAAAHAKGLAVFGLSEHSLRPAGYAYPDDYQPRLAAGFSSYLRETREEQRRYAGRMDVLLALEMDYMPGEEAYARAMTTAQPYDYVIGGLHFLGRWGFDYTAADWENLSRESCAEHFARYYRDLTRMADSGLFQIAAHPDLIKLFRPDDFQAWLAGADALNLARGALTAMKRNGMAMEISSAALRKGLGEPYPCPALMEIARDIGLPVAFGSDSHRADDVAWGFDALSAYARRFGYGESVYFTNRTMHRRSFL